MRLRHIPGAEEAIGSSPYVVQEPEKEKGFWGRRFGNHNPIHIEVGMGKGRFIMEMAALHPEINYIGIERYSSVLLRGLEKCSQLELPNIWFLCVDAKTLGEVFDQGEVSRIYLNFSDPWPKKRHESRRLTYKSFLKSYQAVLPEGGEVEFKTDNRGLFEYSLYSFANFGIHFEPTSISLNLHEDDDKMADNVETEYEHKFASQGYPIYKFVGSFK